MHLHRLSCSFNLLALSGVWLRSLQRLLWRPKPGAPTHPHPHPHVLTLRVRGLQVMVDDRRAAGGEPPPLPAPAGGPPTPTQARSTLAACETLRGIAQRVSQYRPATIRRVLRLLAMVVQVEVEDVDVGIRLTHGPSVRLKVGGL